MASNSTSNTSATSAQREVPSKTQAYIELAIVLSLHAWPALSLAVANNWGGPGGSDKRDWLAGVIADLFLSDPSTDEDDIEDVLLQVMADEFDVNLEDESEEVVARDIVRLRQDCLEGEFGEVKRLQKRWEERQKSGANMGTQHLQITEHRNEDESSGDDDEDEEDEDVDMEDAPQLAASSAPREKAPPEVDEDGFTTVVSKKKR